MSLLNVVITGASSGIGEAFAHQYSKMNCSITLVARREKKLKKIAIDLQAQYGVTVTVIAADLSQRVQVDQLAEQLIMNPPDVLINNAGFGTQGKYHDIDFDKQADMLILHTYAPMALTRAVLPAMVGAGRGTIINVSSIAAWLPADGNATYSATKAFLNTFSLSLAAELNGTGVKVQSLCPGFTRTGFHDTDQYETFSRSSIPARLWMTPQQVVSASLTALERDQVVFVPGLENKLIVSALRAKPILSLARFVRRRLIRAQYRS